MGGIMLAYYSIATNMALYLEQNNLGGAALAGMIISLSTVGGMITSLFLVQIELILKKVIIPVMLLGMIFAFIALTFTNSLTLVMLSVCLIGFRQGTLFPIITLKALEHVSFHQVARAIAFTSSFIFLGQFLSPIVLDGIGQFQKIPSIRFQYGVLAIAMLIGGATSMLYILQSNRRATSSRYKHNRTHFHATSIADEQQFNLTKLG